MAAQGGQISKLYVTITTSLKGLEAGLRNGLAMVRDFAKRAAEYAGGQALWAGMKGLYSAITGAFSGAINNASDLNESISKTNAMLGQSADAALKFAQTMEARGVASAKEVLDSFSNTFSALRNQGFNDAEAFSYAEKLEDRLADVSSQSNKSAEEVRAMLKSGIAGQYDALTGLGVFTTADQLDTRAQASGRGGMETATGQRRERTREMMNEIMRQTASAKGDFEATKYSYANQKRTGDVKAGAVSTRIGQDLLLVGQAFQYFRNRFLTVILGIANNGAFKKIGEMLSQAVSYVGMAFETILPAVMDNIIAGFEIIVRGVKFIAVSIMAMITKPEAVMNLVVNALRLAGYTLVEAVYALANKLTMGLVEKADYGAEKDEARARINESVAAITAQTGVYDKQLEELANKFKASGGQGAGTLTPQQQLSEGVKGGRSAFNSMLSGIFGTEKAYQNSMMNLTRQIAENTKPGGVGAVVVTGPKVAGGQPAPSPAFP